MKIMLCYDGSDEAKEGLIQAIKRARFFSCEVFVVTSVVSDKKLYPKMMEPYEKGAKEAEAFLAKSNISHRVEIVYRHVDMEVGEHLIMMAKSENVDEIIVGIRRRSKLGKLLLGSTAQVLLLKADCPVLGVKAED